MNFQRTLLQTIIAGLAVACGHYTQVTKNGYIVPKKNRYELKNQFALSDTSTLSLSAIYINDYGFAFKFYPDGKLFYCYYPLMSKPNSDSVYGEAGYYSLKDKKLKIEIYVTEEFHVRNYLIAEGELSSDIIRFFKDHYRGTNWTRGRFPQKLHFVKKFLRVYLKDPDW